MPPASATAAAAAAGELWLCTPPRSTSRTSRDSVAAFIHGLSDCPWHLCCGLLTGALTEALRQLGAVISHGHANAPCALPCIATLCYARYLPLVASALAWLHVFVTMAASGPPIIDAALNSELITWTDSLASVDHAWSSQSLSSATTRASTSADSHDAVIAACSSYAMAALRYAGPTGCRDCTRAAGPSTACATAARGVRAALALTQQLVRSQPQLRPASPRSPRAPLDAQPLAPRLPAAAHATPPTWPAALALLAVSASFTAALHPCVLPTVVDEHGLECISGLLQAARAQPCVLLLHQAAGAWMQCLQQPDWPGDHAAPACYTIAQYMSACAPVRGTAHADLLQAASAAAAVLQHWCLGRPARQAIRECQPRAGTAIAALLWSTAVHGAEAWPVGVARAAPGPATTGHAASDDEEDLARPHRDATSAHAVGAHAAVWGALQNWTCDAAGAQSLWATAGEEEAVLRATLLAMGRGGATAQKAAGTLQNLYRVQPPCRAPAEAHRVLAVQLVALLDAGPSTAAAAMGALASLLRRTWPTETFSQAAKVALRLRWLMGTRAAMEQAVCQAAHQASQLARPS